MSWVHVQDIVDGGGYDSSIAAKLGASADVSTFSVRFTKSRAYALGLSVRCRPALLLVSAMKAGGSPKATLTLTCSSKKALDRPRQPPPVRKQMAGLSKL